MRREFADRQALIAYLREQFPEAAAIDDHVPEQVGGRRAAEAALGKLDPQRYAKTRNALSGAVSRLSAYLRYGVLSLAEVRDAALGKVSRRQDAEKYVNELGWRDYWQRLYAEIGDGIWQDREAYKTGFHADQYADDLPEDIAAGTTGLVCIDAFSRELRETGYLHNHARMWMAAYVVHWRRVKWQAGARWFLTHLLDGDPASNNLSWQWVASTFSHKPYFFNRANLERYTDGVYCRDCPLRGECDFEGSYELIEAEIFPNKPPEDQRRANNGSDKRKRREHRGSDHE
ncbi:MAG: deoxyribodipyrimidine photo-lyase [Chloroflexi bacterium]|nr:deoxyribodipyrimidine photo-lyase [Chloroflexota bacterium]